MNRSLIYIILLTIFIHSNVLSNNILDDSTITQVMQDYFISISTKDVEKSKNCFISTEDFNQLIQYVKKEQPNCIGNEEENFSTKLNDKAFQSIIDHNIKINKIFVNRIEYNNSCGNLFTIPRVICTIQYAENKTIEVPFLFVKTINGQYKILRNYFNYKMLLYE